MPSKFCCLPKFSLWLRVPQIYKDLPVLHLKNKIFWFIYIYTCPQIPRYLCCCSSIAKSCLILCDPTDYCPPSSSVLHYLLEFLLIFIYIEFSSVQSLSCVWLFATPWTAACQASLSITNSWSLLKLTSIELVMPSNHLILCHPLLLLCSVFPSIRVFSNETVLCIRWPKYWSFSFCISPVNIQD